jgi:hypothetical protein
MASSPRRFQLPSVSMDASSTPRASRAVAHIMQRRELIYAALSRAAGNQLKGMSLGWEGRWLTALRADLEAPTGQAFVSSLDAPLRRPGQGRRELDAWLEVLATFRQEQEAFWKRLQHELAQLSIHTCFVTLFTDSGRERSRLRSGAEASTPAPSPMESCRAGLWAYSSRETELANSPDGPARLTRHRPPRAVPAKFAPKRRRAGQRGDCG